MDSLDHFYSIDARRESAEISFGLNWRSANYPTFEFSVFWLEATQELCALWSPIRDVRSDGPVSRWVLGVPPHTNPQELRDEEVTVEVLGTFPEAEVQRRLAGWEAHNAEPDGFGWLRRQVPIPLSDRPRCPFKEGDRIRHKGTGEKATVVIPDDAMGDTHVDQEGSGIGIMRPQEWIEWELDPNP